VLIPRAAVVASQRMRAIGTRLYPRPLEETTHEFLVYALMNELGGDWAREQGDLPDGRRHVVMRWYDELAASRAGASIDEEGDRSAIASGNLQALLCLAEDVIDVLHAAVLDDALLARLRTPDHFQGARYELAMAAVFLRTGFRIAWIPPTAAEQTPEFTAIGHGVEFDVEVKSKHRSGVLGYPGATIDPEITKVRAGTLLNDARAKADGTRPFVACIDLNLPGNSSRTDVESWMGQVKDVFRQIPMPTAEAPDVVSGYLLTNFAYHYEGEGEMSDLGQSFLVISMYRTSPVPDEVLHCLRETCATYGALPPRDW
jgi:hypothetical protein